MEHFFALGTGFAEKNGIFPPLSAYICFATAKTDRSEQELYCSHCHRSNSVSVTYISDLPMILLSLLQMTWKWCSREPNQTAFAPLFLPPGHGRGNGTYQSKPTSAHASLIGTSFLFLRLSPLQTPIIKSTDVQDLVFPLARLSPWQCTVVMLRIQYYYCYFWSANGFLDFIHQPFSYCTIP